MHRQSYRHRRVDEIGKITRKSGANCSITRDISGERVQQVLLKIIEGTVAQIPVQGDRKHPLGEQVPLDTSHVLVICGGTFEGLSELVGRRLVVAPFQPGTRRGGR